MIIPDTIDILGLARNESAGRKMAEEVRRIGRKAEVFWNIQSAWDEMCLRHIQPSSKYMSKVSSFSCRRGHYHIVQKAIDMGRSSVWIVEDDARFLKDVDEINERLDRSPADADILFLDYNVAGDIQGENYIGCHRKMDEAKNGWWKIEMEDIRGAGDYILSREAMVKYAEYLEIGKHGDPIVACDVGRNAIGLPRLNIYASTPNLSIQQLDDNYNHMCEHNTLRDNWMRCGVNPDNYQSW